MFNELDGKFEQAERTTKIQSGTIEEITRIISRLRQEESFWHDRSDIDPKDAFAMYHALRNARLVAQKLKARVELAPQANDNPQVAADGLKIMPTLSIIANKGNEYKTHSISSQARKEIYSIVFRLRNEARKYNLLLSETEEREEMTAEELKKQSRALAKTVESTIGNTTSNS